LYHTLEDIIDELVPICVRGKNIIGTMYAIAAQPEDIVPISSSDYSNLTITYYAGGGAPRFAVVRLKLIFGLARCLRFRLHGDYMEAAPQALVLGSLIWHSRRELCRGSNQSGKKNEAEEEDGSCTVIVFHEQVLLT